jgi:hypothetical protein
MHHSADFCVQMLYNSPWRVYTIHKFVPGTYPDPVQVEEEWVGKEIERKEGEEEMRTPMIKLGCATVHHYISR